MREYSFNIPMTGLKPDPTAVAGQNALRNLVPDDGHLRVPAAVDPVACADSRVLHGVNKTVLVMPSAAIPEEHIWRVNATPNYLQNGLTWDTAFNDIQSAVDAAYAAGGGEVWVAAGTYTGTGLYVLELREGVSVYGGFAGTEEETHGIAVDDVWDLQDVVSDLSGWYYQSGHIDASDTAGWNGGAGFLPIGTSGAVFTGRYNGQGLEIQGLVQNRPSDDNIGLFGAVGGAGAAVYGIRRTGGSTTGRQSVGGIAGYAGGGLHIEYCVSTANVTGTSSRVGGLVGRSAGNLHISQCAVHTGTVSGLNVVGGLLGRNDAAGLHVSDSYAFVNIVATSTSFASAGGIVGANHQSNACSYTRCFSACDLSGVVHPTMRHGFVGEIYHTPLNITACYYDVDRFGHAPIDAAGVPGKTSTEMHTAATYDGYDFDAVWAINEGVSPPTLRPVSLGMASRDITANVTIIDGEGERVGIVAVGPYADHVTLEGFIVKNCYAQQLSQSGGGMLCNNASVNVVRCIFRDNTSPWGGALFAVFDSDVTLTNCVINDNHAPMVAGGAGNGGALAVNDSTVTAMNCTIVGNEAGRWGGAVVCSWNGTTTLINTILRLNVAGLENDQFHTASDGTVTATYCRVQETTPGAGNIEALPQFISGIPPRDLRLQAGSPCLDTGTANGAPAIDIRGVTRPQGGGVDMGAYERQAGDP